MKYCYKCYNSFEDNENYRYCPFCGEPLYDEELVPAEIYGVWEAFTEGKSLGTFEGDLDDIAYYLNNKRGNSFNFTKLNSQKVKEEDVTKDRDVVIPIKKINGFEEADYWALRKAFEDKGLALTKKNGYLELKVGI